MGIMYNFAIIVIIVEGIIIQCQGYPNSPNRTLDSGTNEAQPNSTQESTITNDSTAQNTTTQDSTERTEMRNLTESELIDYFNNLVVVINPQRFIGSPDQYTSNDVDLFYEIGSYENFVSFFENFGNYVRKIKVHFVGIGDESLRREIDQNIMKVYASNLVELRLTYFEPFGIVDNLSTVTDIVFPNVTFFQFDGEISLDEFKLDLKFPKLETVILSGKITDQKCLANVKTLKALETRIYPIEDDQLITIFQNNNEKLKVIDLFPGPKKRETLDAIAKFLTNLESFGVNQAGEDFLFRPNNQTMLYTLSSVQRFGIAVPRNDELDGDFSFEMPNLKALRLTIPGADHGNYDRVIDYIKKFKELEWIDLFIMCCDDFENRIEKIKKLLEEANWTVRNDERLGNYHHSLFLERKRSDGEEAVET